MRIQSIDALGVEWMPEVYIEFMLAQSTKIIFEMVNQYRWYIWSNVVLLSRI